HLMSLIVRELIVRGCIERALIVFNIMKNDSIQPDSTLLAFGLRVAELRKEREISQEELALISGLARSYVSGVERGLRNISLLNILRLANALEVPPSSL